ncbi:MAG TPA: ATPase, partial [Actinomycetes bacterium]|nr:ATPase [Actinomycetes bacterium]
ATLQLIRAAKASAALDDRDYVIPDDVRLLAVPVLAHRLLLTAEAQIARRTSSSVVEALVDSTPIPAAG